MPRPNHEGAGAKALLKEQRRQGVIDAYLAGDQGRGALPQISRDKGVPLSTVKSIVRKFKDTGSVVATKQTGRPTK